jgi:translation initiation factor 1
MSRKHERIDTSPAQAGLNAAFAGLEISGLPPAPEPAPSQLPAAGQKKRGRVVLRREKAHRGGKTVIVVHDFPTHLPLSEIEELARKLRAACGCGGTVKDRTIEVQGDQPGKIREILEREGFQAAGVT